MKTAEQKLVAARALYIKRATKAARERAENARPGKRQDEARKWLAMAEEAFGDEFDRIVEAEDPS